MSKAQRIIKVLNLLPHPEGGYYRETYRSSRSINNKCLESGYSGDRNYSTCIYFLLTSDTFSAFHRIKQDEIWHFYDGAPIALHAISESGKHSEFIIGNDFSRGQVPQLVVAGGCWFAAKVLEPDSYTLVGCTVSPGFDFNDFELPSREDLIAKFPEHTDLITEFTRINP